MDVSIVIVNYNAGDYLRICIESLRQHISLPFEIVVVDNDSKDNSLENLPVWENLRIVRAGANLGFAKGCNLGASKARGKILHFLNPDTRVTENINEAYSRALEGHREIGVTRVYDTRAKDERSSYPFPTLGNVLRMFLAPGKVKKWYLGASVVVRREIFQEIGGWSEEYFIYAEDMDFFFKADRAGISVHESQALVIHDQGAITANVWSEVQRLERVEKSAFVFVRKFGLWLDYFVFKHAAFIRMFIRAPKATAREYGVFWRTFCKSISS